MSKERNSELLQEIDQALSELEEIWDSARSKGDPDDFDHRFKRWESRWTSWIKRNLPQEAESFGQTNLGSIIMGYTDPWHYATESYEANRKFFSALAEDVKRFPETVTEEVAEEPSEIARKPTAQADNKAVFIVHGHDDANLAVLCGMLRKRFELEPIVLKEKPGRSRTIIEKFEEEAKPAAFALALLSPDDMVETKEGTYAQARPNVVFELGWFFARLGRNNVRIILKKGTQIHSDLDGIERIEFHDSVEETLIKLERELEAGGYSAEKKEFAP